MKPREPESTSYKLAYTQASTHTLTYVTSLSALQVLNEKMIHLLKRKKSLKVKKCRC